MKTAKELCVSIWSSVCHTHMTVQLVTSLLTPTQTHQCPYCLLQPQLWTQRQGQQRRREDVADRSTFPISPKTRATILTRRDEEQPQCPGHLQNYGRKKPTGLVYFCFLILNVIKVTANNVGNFCKYWSLTVFHSQFRYNWFIVYPCWNDLIKRHVVVACKVKHWLDLCNMRPI